MRKNVDVIIVLDGYHERIQEQDRVERLERAGPPLVQQLLDRVGRPADELGRNVRVVDILEVSGDLAGRHAAGVHRQDLVVEAL